jgi:tRNA(Ile)-lysidine synthetase-like protein
MKKILGNIRKTIQENNLISEGDRIAIGVSGGKDSMVLLHAMKKLQSYYPIKFEIAAFLVDLGLKDFPVDVIKDYCKSLDVPFHIVKTQIFKVVFKEREETNPCSLCAKMRRGALYEAITELEFNKVALGHHQDDAVETLFLNMIYTGRINTFMMNTYLSRKDIHVIRPMILTPEKDIIHVQRSENIPIAVNPCPMDKKTSREDMKRMLSEFYHSYPESRKNFAKAIINTDQVQLVK